MTSDLDIFRSARLLIERHGDKASIHATTRAAAMLEAGDLDGRIIWKRVVRAIKELQDQEPAAKGKTVH